MKNKLLLLVFGLIISSQIVYSQLPSYVPTNGLVGYWPFNGNANDQSGNGLNGTVTGATLTSDRNGVSNSAYSFNPSIASKISIQTQAVTGTGLLNQFSIVMWVKANRVANFISESSFCPGSVNVSMANSNQNWAFVPSNAGVNLGVGFSLGTNGIMVSEHANNILVSRLSNASTYSNFVHVAIVYNANNSYLYVNNVLVRTRSMYCSANTKGIPSLITLGSALYSSNFSGIIDDFGIWNRALTQSEIQQLYIACTTPAPTGIAAQNLCSGSTVANLSATGTTIKWYTTTSGGTALASTTALVNGTTYYASQTVNGCESRTRLAVTVSLNNLVSPASSSQTLCINTALMPITHTTTGATGIGSVTGLPAGVIAYWSANTITISGTPTVSGTFNYRVPLTGGCGTVYATGIIIVNPNNTVTAASVFPTTCINTALQVINHTTTGATGIGIATGLPLGVSATWSSNTITISGTPSVSGTFNYSIPLTGGCGGYATGTIIVNTNPAPTGSVNQSVCSGSTIANLTATGTAIQWYASATGGTPLPSTTVIVSGTTYFASQTVSGCESPSRLAVTANFLIVNAPTGNAIQYFCGQSTIASFVLNGSSVKWYATSTGGTELPLTTLITNGAFYYASNNINNCESSTRYAVRGYIKNTGLTASSTTVCGGSPVTLTASDSTSASPTFLWSTGDTTASLVVTPQVSTTYWVDIISFGSSCRKYISIIVNNPTVTASNAFLCQPGTVTITANSQAGLSTNSCSSTILSTNLQSNLLAWYPFCGNVNDQTSNNNNGTVTGTTTYVNDRNNNPSSAFFFNGATKIQIPHNNSLNAFPFSVSAWVKSSDLSPGHIIGKYENATWNGWTLWSDPKGSGFYLRGRNSALISGYDDYPEFSTSPVNDNSWHNLVFVADQYSGRIYLDGVLQDTQLWRGTPGVANSSWPMIIGYYAHTYVGIGTETGYFNGATDDIGVWGRALTDVEVQQLYSLQRTATYLWSTGETTATINPSLTQTTQYWVDITLNGITCRKNITIAVVPNTTPTGSTNQTLCSASTVTDLMATGTGIKWYATATGGTALASTTALVNGTTYYASQTVNGCESTTRLAVTVSLNNPTVSASSSSICAGTNVALTANDNLTTSQIQTQLNNLVNSGLWNLKATYNNHYYLQYQSRKTWPQAKVLCEQNGGYMYCVNSQLENDNVSVPIANSQVYGDFLLGLYQDTTAPNYSEPSGGWKWLDGSPLSYTNWGQNEPNDNGGSENFCVMDWNNMGAPWNDTTNSIAGTVIMEYPGNTTYVWSTGATTATINVTPTTTTQYWVDVTTNGVTCRKNITITVSPIIIPTFTPVASICSGAALAALPTTSSNGITGTWSPALNNTATTTYTFTPTAGQCATTATMTIAVNPNFVPTFTSVPAICSGATLAALPTTSLNGISGTWSPALNNTATTTYTFRPNVGQCASITTLVITVNPIVNAPTGIASQTLCSGSIVANLTATGTALKWYASITGGTPLATTTALLNGTTYYASQTINGCESMTRLAVTVSINNPTVSASTTSICAGQSTTISVGGTSNLSGPYYFNGHTYFKGISPVSWSQAVQNSINNGGHLFIPNSLNEINFVIQNLYNNSAPGVMNIGITDAQNEGIWLDVLGNRLNYTNWDLGEPNNQGGNENYGLMYSTGKWNDGVGSSNELYPYIVEFEGINSSYLWSTGATTATINVTPTATTQYWVDVTTNGVTCRKYITITVSPNVVPTFTSVPAICSGATLAALPTTSLNGIPGTWSPALNNTATTTYTFRPNVGQCAVSTTMTIAVNAIPTPPVITRITQPTCLSPTGSVYLSGLPTGIWTLNPGGIRGIGTTRVITRLNPGIGNFTVTNSAGCTSNPSLNFVINPQPVMAVPLSQVVCNNSGTQPIFFTSNNTGGTTTYNWTNSDPSIGLSASGTGNIQSFIAVNYGTSPIVSTITVTPTFINGGISCTDASTTFTITVNPSGQVNQATSQVVCSGSTTTAVLFSTYNTSGTTTYSWVNSDPSIGLAATGTGDIPSFTAINTRTAPVISTISVFPSMNNGGSSCPGTPTTFTITVNPLGQVNQVAPQVVCNATSSAPVIFITNNTGGTSTYYWTNSNPTIGLVSSGTGNISSFTAINTGVLPVISTIKVTPTFTNAGLTCVGVPMITSVTVNPCVPIPTCGGSFYDNGGANANYANNTTSTTTICPNSIGDAVTVTFNSFSTEAGLDILRIYDGNSPNSPLIGTLSGTIIPGSFTSSSANGCLTFVFTSDNTVTSAGWNASVTCNPRTTCSRPINLNATSISQSSAVLGWGQPANPNGSIASYWQVMAVPCGTAAPTTSSTGWRNTATNSYIFTGLNSATCYDFYVRAVCSSTDSSLISGPFNFHTLITNDEAIGAISVPVNQNTNCLQTVMGSLATATASQVDNSCGAALDDDDVWFKFTATAASHNISILGVNYTITPTNINYVLYTGTPGNLTQFGGCVLTNNYTANGLTIGQTYYIRAYSTATTAVTTYFELCIGTNVENCSSALALCGTQPTILPNTVGVPTLPNPISPFSTSSSAVGCLLTAPSPTFFYLNVPTNGNYSYLIEQNTNNTFTGTGLDVDFVAWGPFTSTAAACAGISTANAPATGIACSYSAAFTENFTVNNAIAGEIYVLMITNFNGRKGFIRLTQTAGPVTSACCPRGNFTYSNTSYCQNGANPSPIFGNNANAGVFSAVPSNGLSINPTTGLVNLAASLPGTYVIHNSITSSGSCPADDDSWTIIITQQPSISMFYAGSPFCNSSNIGAVTLMGTGAYTGGTFSSQPGLSINSINGTITPSTSIPGTYTVTYTIPPSAGCASVVVTSTVVITRAPIAMFTYAGSPYCNNGINPSPIFAPSGIAGVFTSTSGLSINATTGVINSAISFPGTYIVTNTIAASGGCPSVSASTNVEIIAVPTVNISYGRDYFCTNFNGVQPSLTGTGNYFGGTFIGSPGLSIDPFSGVIFPSSSTIGYHTVTYVIPSNGGCPLSTTTTSFAITPIPVATATPSQLSICSLGNAYIVLNSNAIGTTYTWNAVQTNVIGATSGTGTVINNVLRATGNTSGTVVYTITPFSGGCVGAPFTASVIVNPVPSVYVPANAYYSNNEIVPATVFSSNLTGVTYAWTNTNSSIGLPSSGTGSIPSFTASNLGNVPVTGYITVTPSLNGCVGTPRTYSITVAPSASTIGNISINSTRSSIDLFDTITVEVQLTNATDLYSLYMKLKGNLAVSQYLDYSGYTASTLLGYPADVIATDPIVTNGEYDFGITKIGNVPGFTGSGLFYTFRFVTKNIPIPAGTNFCFYLDQISAYNPAGIACNLTNQGQYCFTFSNQTNVWPGDLNNNRSVTTADLLPIGYFYGSQGPTRPNANLQWTAQPAVLWGYNHSSINGNAYMVFADSNGDGVINNADQAAVGRNMNQVHYRIATPFRDNTPLTQSNGDLVVTPDITTVNALTSQTVTFSVSLNNTGGLNGLYGISVNLLFDDTVFDLSSATIDYTGSIFGIVGVDCLAINNTTIDTESVGLTRFSNAAINGHGLLFKVTLQTRFPFVSSSNQTLVSSNVEAANNQFGDPLVIQDAPATNIVIINNNLGVNTAETKDFILYPNPANEVINIVMGTNASQLGDLKLKVINVLGQTVEKTNIQNTTREISTKNWGASGVYFVEISNSDDTVLMTKKVIVVRK